MCWLEMAHRIRLYQQYGSKPFLNHVADGYFVFVGAAAFFALMLFAAGALISKSTESSSLFVSHLGGGIVMVMYLGTLFFLNQQDMLVTYGEYVRNMGP